MRRFTLGFVVAACLLVPTVVFAAGGDQTVKGNLTVNGNASIAGDTFTGSVQAAGSAQVSNFGTVAALHTSAGEYDVTAGGFGYAWTDSDRNVVTRIIAGQFADPTAVAAPPSSLLLRRDPAQLWFRTDAGWTCIAGC